FDGACLFWTAGGDRWTQTIVKQEKHLGDLGEEVLVMHRKESSTDGCLLEDTAKPEMLKTGGEMGHKFADVSRLVKGARRRKGEEGKCRYEVVGGEHIHWRRRRRRRRRREEEEEEEEWKDDTGRSAQRRALCDNELLHFHDRWKMCSTPSSTPPFPPPLRLVRPAYLSGPAAGRGGAWYRMIGTRPSERRSRRELRQWKNLLTLLINFATLPGES
ncbi:unnamed protein product, partial [Pleuronectes platessa]